MSFFDERQGLSPEDYARAVLFELKITSFPVDVKSIVTSRGIVYRESDFQGIQSIDGALRRQGGKAMIVVNNAIPFSGRKNFTIAHELGHFEIKGHDSNEYQCTNKDLDAFQSEKTFEFEANRFAAELLMPEQKIQEIMKRKPFNFETIEIISTDFATSLTSSAVKAIKVTDDPCAIVVSVDNRISWSWRSKSFHYEIKPKRQILSEDTYATDFFQGKSVPDQPSLVSPFAWLASTKIPNDLELLEHSVCFSNINMVLSLITLPEKDDYEIDNDESEFDNY